MESSIAERIRFARESKDLEHAVLSRKMHVSERILRGWESGQESPDEELLRRLARHVGVEASWLATGEGEMSPEPAPANVLPLFKDSLHPAYMLMDIPVLSSIPAGKTTPMFHPEYADRYVTVDNVKDKSAFALVVKGTSMSPRIEEGDIVVVSPKEPVRSGDICVVRVNDEDVLKKIKIDDEYVHLIPLNKQFEPVTVRKQDVSLIWKVIKVIKNL
jgi:repressor LexA